MSKQNSSEAMLKAIGYFKLREDTIRHRLANDVRIDTAERLSKMIKDKK